jgi:hypothetical protein
MVDQEYVSALVVFGKTSPGNLTLLKNRVMDLFNYITLNQGKDLTTVSIPGQHLSWSKTYTAQEEFSAIQQARCRSSTAS